MLLVWSVSPASAWVPDAWITVKVKTALLVGEGGAAGGVNVDTTDGRVTLDGTVESPAARRRMGQAARAVDGVRAVRNRLRIARRAAPSPAPAAAVARADVARVLAARPALAKVRVVSVEGDTIVLAGEVEGATDHLEALRAVRRLPGIRRVWSEVTVTGVPDAVDIVDGRELEDGGRGLADAAADVWLTTEVKLRLLADDRVPALAVNVDTTNGAVTLFGAVPSVEARAAAVATARGVAGVRSVSDHLEIVPPVRAAAVAAHDAELTTAVRARIAARRELTPAVVHVAVENGVVRLTGTAPTRHHRLVAATAAGEVAGVRAVIADLQIRRMTRAPGTS